jgi:tRNA(Ile)-lysidine synthase
LHILNQLRQRLGFGLLVAHLNHGVRGAEGERDARFVAELAARMSLPFEGGDWRPEREGGFEAAARAARLAWLASVAVRNNAKFVALGHTKDDQAETVLHRLLRGTGTRGLRGIPDERKLTSGVRLIRPLLSVSRVEIRTFLQSCGQVWNEDSSNQDCGKTRARIRHELLPRLAADFNPQVVEALVRIANACKVEHEWISRGCAAWCRRHQCEWNSGSIRLPVEPFHRLSQGRRVEVVRWVWRRVGWPERSMSSQRWAALVEAGATRVDLGGKIFARVIDGWLIAQRAGPVAPAIQELRPSVLLAVPGEQTFEGTRVSARLASVGSDVGAERIDFDRLEPFILEGNYCLEIRHARHGDRFDPLGMRGQTQRVSEFLRCRGVPSQLRSASILVCDRQGVVWIVGHRISDRVRITDSTKEVLHLNAQEA